MLRKPPKTYRHMPLRDGELPSSATCRRSQMRLGRDFHITTPRRTFTVSDSLWGLLHELLSSLSPLGLLFYSILF